mmetsp:Transcript_9380/g.20971  ORF Transcript_9380/g.20971 Transcript_9380/m.20971 type:complete len:455 (-) Transcript_9380:136-1500(-)
MVEPTASSFAITLNLITAGFGTGLLTMPWGTAGSSIFMSLLILLVVLMLNAWVVMILVTASQKCATYELGTLMSKLPWKLGSILQVVGNATVWMSQILVLLGYTIIIVSGLERLLPASGILTSRPALTAAVAALSYPLSLLDQQRLAWTSSIGIAANIYIVGLVLCYALPYMTPEALAAAPLRWEEHEAHSGRRHLCVWGVSFGSVTNFDLQMSALNILMLILPMYKELERKSPEKFMRCLGTSYVFLYVVFALVMVCGYAAFGPHVESNLLDAMPNDAWAQAARFSMILCLLGCYPLNLKPMITPFLNHDASLAQSDAAGEPLLAADALTSGQHIEHAAPRVDHKREAFLQMLVTFLVIAGVSIVSLFLNDLGPLNALNGALQIIAFVGVIPCSLGLFLVGDNFTTSQRWFHRIALGFLFVLALIISSLSFVDLQNEPKALEAACRWHLDLEL